MHARVALLSLFLAGPALAAPVVRPSGGTVAPDADNAAILAVISAADPELTTSPSPVAPVIEAAETAERRLAAATDLDAVGELLTLVGMAREVAYQRTGAADHLCALIAASGDVLRRPGLSSTLAMEAADFRSRARDELAAKHPDVSCEGPESREPAPRAVLQPSVVPSPPRSAASTARSTPKLSGVGVAGVVLLGVAGAMGGALVGVRIVRDQASDDLRALLGEVQMAGGKTAAQAAQIDHFRGTERRTDAATVGLGVSIGVLAALGVGLAVWGNRRSASTQRAQLSPYGGPLGAGVMLGGSF